MRFNDLYAAHYNAVRAYVWRRDPALCDDVLAETFLVAWRRLDRVPADARPWLIGVARNARLNLRRGARRRDALSHRLVDHAAAVEPAAPARESEVVRAALAQLSERDREVLLLVVWDDLDRDAVARALGCSKANVSLRLHRARRRVAELVDELREPGAPLSSTVVPGGASDAC